MMRIILFIGLFVAMSGPLTTDAQDRWSELGRTDIFNGSIYSIATDAASNVYATGNFIKDNGSRQYHYVAKWDGQSWSELGTGASMLSFHGWINCLSTDIAGNVYIAGSLFNPGTGMCVVKWDGTAWTELGTGTNALNANEGIFALNIDAKGNIYVGGRFTNDSGYRYVAKWDGTRWTELGFGAGALKANGDICAIATDTFGYVYASGQFTNDSGKYYVARWDGTSWAALGTGPNKPNANAELYHLSTDKAGNLYAAAWFRRSYGRIGFVAKWDGADWTDLDTGFNGLNPYREISALMTDTAGNVYAAGIFVDTNGWTPYNVAKWDGISWTLLGQDNELLNGSNMIGTLAHDANGNIYAAGAIRNSESRNYVARYGPATTAVDDIDLHQDDINVYPNPNRGQFTIAGDWILRNSELEMSIGVYDLLGRQVNFFSTKVSKGVQVIDILLDENITGGLYYLQLASGEARATRKIFLDR